MNTSEKYSHHSWVCHVLMHDLNSSHQNVFVALHVLDPIVVVPSSHLDKVVRVMQLRFSMKVSLPLAARPSSRLVESMMLEEHGMRVASAVVPPALARTREDDEAEDATPEVHRVLRRALKTSQFFGRRRPASAPTIFGILSIRYG